MSGKRTMVPIGEGVSRLNEELVGQARVLEVLDERTDVESEYLVWLQILDNLPSRQEVVDSLHRVHNMRDTVSMSLGD